jgi:hypothetical protein
MEIIKTKYRVRIIILAWVDINNIKEASQLTGINNRIKKMRIMEKRKF